MSGSSTPPGWYPDPSNPAQQRYWDGNAWSDATAPGAAAGAAPAVPGYGATQVGYGYAQAMGAPLAGFWTRFGAYFVDAVLVGIVVSILAAIVGIDTGDTAAYQVLNLVVAAPYFIYFEGSTGQTMGKKLLKIQVVDQETLQSGIGNQKAVYRYLGRILSSIPCGLGYFWMLWDDQKQTWHDKIAGTKVVKVAA